MLIGRNIFSVSSSITLSDLERQDEKKNLFQVDLLNNAGTV